MKPMGPTTGGASATFTGHSREAFLGVLLTYDGSTIAGHVAPWPMADGGPDPGD